MGLDFGAINTALKAWAVAGTGFAADRVLFDWEKYQGGARPTGGAHVTIQIGPGASHSIDGYTTDTDLSRGDGREIRLKTVAMRAFTVTLQAFGGIPAGNGSALSVLSRLREKSVLPSVRDILTAGGIAPFEFGTVRYIPSIQGTKFEGRSMLEVRCYLDCSEEEYTTFFRSVTVAGTVDAQPVSVTAALPEE